jgi:hypothetical protein
VARQAVHRVEAGRVSPRLETLDRLLAVCGFAVTLERRLGADVARSPIRELLRISVARRLPSDHWRAVRLLGIRVRWAIVIGDAAARLHGAPIDVQRLDVLVYPSELNRCKVDRFRLDLPWAARYVDVAWGWDEAAWRATTRVDLGAIFRTPRTLASLAVTLGGLGPPAS